MIRLIFTLLLVVIASIYLPAQEVMNTDSLENLLESSADTTKARIHYDLGLAYQYNNPDKALFHAGEAENIYKAFNSKKWVSKSLVLRGKIYKSNGQYKEGLNCQLKALKMNEEMKDNKAIAISYNDIGILYKILKRHDLALNYYRKSLDLCRQTGFTHGIVNTLNNIGTIYNEKAQLDSALYYYQESLELSYTTNDENGQANALSNIGEIYAKQKHFDKALEYFEKTLELDIRAENKYGQVLTLINIAGLQHEQNKLNEAVKNYMAALDLSKEIDALPLQQECYSLLSQAYEKLNNCDKALEYHRLFAKTYELILNEESSKQIAEMQEKYNSEKKDQEIVLLNKNKQIQAEEIKRQKLVSYSVGFGLCLVILLAFFIFKGYKEKKKANLELTDAYQKIEEKNKDITDSINYASRIQSAILPSPDVILKSLPNSFIYFQPKDIVSGDFYFFAEVITNGVKHKIIAAADCTGHGVPGAFMSMIGNELLNKIILERLIVQPAEILSQLHEGIRKALKQDSTGTQTMDGMDIAVCSINESTKEVQYAGALRNLYIVNNESLAEVKADKQSIGGIRSDVTKTFQNHTIPFSPDKAFYIFSDGFADQFGGTDGKKFMTKRFKDLLQSLNGMPMNLQKDSVSTAFTTWKQNYSQVDDVLVIGFKV